MLLPLKALIAASFSSEVEAHRRLTEYIYAPPIFLLTPPTFIVFAMDRSCNKRGYREVGGEGKEIERRGC